VPAAGPAPALDPAVGSAPDEITSVTRPDAATLAIAVDARAPGWLHVAGVDDGFWTAMVDTREVPISRANGPFMAVPITEPGAHAVVLAYRPLPFRVGLVVAAVAAFALALLCLVSRRRRRATSALSGRVAAAGSERPNAS